MRKLLTVEQAAERLGLTAKAVRIRVSQKSLPFVKLGALLRIPENDLETYLETLVQCDAAEALQHTKTAYAEKIEMARQRADQAVKEAHRLLKRAA